MYNLLGTAIRRKNEDQTLEKDDYFTEIIVHGPLAEVTKFSNSLNAMVKNLYPSRTLQFPVAVFVILDDIQLLSRILQPITYAANGEEIIVSQLDIDAWTLYGSSSTSEALEK